jgi:hypothetical protein
MENSMQKGFLEISKEAKKGDAILTLCFSILIS